LSFQFSFVLNGKIKSHTNRRMATGCLFKDPLVFRPWITPSLALSFHLECISTKNKKPVIIQNDNWLPYQAL